MWQSVLWTCQTTDLLTSKLTDMPEVLLINRDDIMRISALKGNLDEDKILPHIKTAQDIHIQPVIGTKLLEKLKTLVEANELDAAGNENYKELVYVYLTPTEVFYTLWDAMPFLQYEIANGGVFQHLSENSNPPSDETVQMLVQKFKDKAEFYGLRMTEYLCDNQSDFPELNDSTTGSEMNPQGQDAFHGWVVD